jgi:hypothetical protein
LVVVAYIIEDASGRISPMTGKFETSFLDHNPAEHLSYWLDGRLMADLQLRYGFLSEQGITFVWLYLSTQITLAFHKFVFISREKDVSYHEHVIAISRFCPPFVIS